MKRLVSSLFAGAVALSSANAWAAYCEGVSHIACYPGVDRSGRDPAGLYQAAIEGLKNAQDPTQGRLAVDAMYDAFSARGSDWRAIYCNVHAGGPNNFLNCVRSLPR